MLITAVNLNSEWVFECTVPRFPRVFPAFSQRNYNDDKTKLAKLGLYFYALRKDGEHAAGSLWAEAGTHAAYTVNDGGESRHEECVFLYQR